ncbi:hypothetical protein NADFUDRAFT_83104 [Nadsonia fulvescens var. elongata DSM 6958]|uniref:Uncharacterized protein n=1 Tax=Nadsonia fulvescens var. elongata DSM 6958 TaxID=857566 RepID=A0A1E3PHU3_9ASCO|nr:hypothetical protein NADFUDRAFT_83104 [Nadsonia fulvescens var. elongata DSM 6958]
MMKKSSLWLFYAILYASVCSTVCRSNNDRILLSDVKSLNSREGDMNTAERTPLVP